MLNSDWQNRWRYIKPRAKLIPLTRAERFSNWFRSNCGWLALIVLLCLAAYAWHTDTVIKMRSRNPIFYPQDQTVRPPDVAVNKDYPSTLSIQ